jgi:hypothetical protein
MGVYDSGTLVRLSVTFTLGGADTDPGTVSATVKSPAATTTYTYGGGTVSKDATGKYHFDITPAVAGTWYYSWTAGTGVVVTTHGEFAINPLPTS